MLTIECCKSVFLHETPEQSSACKLRPPNQNGNVFLPYLWPMEKDSKISVSKQSVYLPRLGGS